MRLALALLFFAAVVAVRLPVAATHVSTWGVYEVHSGTIAQAFLDGLDIDIQRLPIMAHVRGSALLGFMLVPIYAVLGTSALALKLAPLLWHAATIGLLFYVLDRFFSRRAAITAGLLFVFAPPMLDKLSVLGFGSHMESSLIVLGALIPFLAITLEKRNDGRTYALFGLMVGLAHTWHLQAMLSCLVLGALLVVCEPRRLLRGRVLWVLGGVALGAAPSFCFSGLGDVSGSWGLLLVKLINPQQAAENTGVLSEAHGPILGVGAKLAVLAKGGYVQLYEFFEAGPSGRWFGPLYALAVLVAGAMAIIQDRKRFAALFRRVFRFKSEDISPAAYFPLHAVTLLAFYLLVTSKINFTELSSGHPNRRLSPMIFSLMVLAAVGMSGIRKPTPRVVWLGFLIPMCLAGALGLWGVANGTEADRMVNRGEAYEWFTLQLSHHAGGNMQVLAETIQTVDRGDPRFRPLRFMLPFARLDLDDPALLEQERRKRASMSPELALYRATHLGRLYGGQPMRLRPTEPIWQHIESLPPAERQALLHGIGMGLLPPRPDYPAQWAKRFPFIANVFRHLPEPHVQVIAEGYGYLRGFPYDPWVEAQLRMVADYGELPASVRNSFYRGFGWGYRQRYLDPPDAMPAGLTADELVPPENREAFRSGYLARVVPEPER